MKGLLIFIFVCITHYSFSQPFSEKTSNGFTFAGEENSAAAFVDIDNDGDEDILHSSVFYKNNNEEGFSSFFTFGGTTHTINAFGDYNGDGFADILFGNTLYRSNAGTGFTAIRTFTETPNVISFADFNNDAQADIILTGSTSSILYRNNNGAFNQEQTLSGGTDVAHGDIDADGDLDVLIDKSTVPSYLFYENNNTGFASIFENILTRTTTGTPNLIDFDADGDLDIFVSNTLYKNNETGFSIYSKISISHFVNYHSSWADVDNDGFADLVISGTENNLPTLTIYKNNRTSFAAITSIPNITKHTLTDLDADGDVDIFFPETGRFYENKTTVRNNVPNTPGALDASVLETGEYEFSWSTPSDAETPSAGLHYEVYFSTNNPDNITFPTLILKKNQYTFASLGAGVYYWKVRAVDPSGNTSNWSATQTYITNKANTATEITNKSFVANWEANPNAVAYTVDVAQDRNWTLFVLNNSYTSSTSKRVTGLTANTQYYYRVRTITPQGTSDYSASIVPRLGTFIDTVSFVATTISPLSLRNGSSNFADYDNDGDMDFFINGTGGTTPNALFQRLQNNNTVLASPTSIANAYSNNSLFGDYNNDNRLDFFVGGRVYQNNANAFSQTSFSFPNIPSGSSNFVDYDNDGDRDIFITGYESSISQGVSRLFKNNKTNFAEIISLGITNVENSASTFGDIDNDGDMDALISGWNGSARITKLYENRNGQFYELTSTTFAGIQNGSVSLVDLDNDGYLDVFTTGDIGDDSWKNNNWIEGAYGPPYVNIPSVPLFFLPYLPDTLNFKKYYPLYVAQTSIYKRNEGLSFLPSSDNGINGFTASHTFFGDYDNDGDKDVFVIGRFRKSYKYVSVTNITWGNRSGCCRDYLYYTYYPGLIIYKNTDGDFTEVFSEEFSQIEYLGFRTNTNSGALSDYDNDGDLDFIINTETNGRYTSKIYENRTTNRNTPPTLPQSILSYNYGVGKAVFIWQNAEDTKIPAAADRNQGNGLSYNIYIGTASNKNLLRSPQALTDGTLTLPQAGDLQGNVYKIENIPNGNYVWGIQTIDQGLMGSPFSTEQTLEITTRASTQSISFPALAARAFLDLPFTISATATSGLPVSFLSTNTHVATVSGNRITIVGAGETNIIAYQTGNVQYYGAYPVTQTLRVNRGQQVITFGNIPDQTVGVPFRLEVSANSGLSISIYKDYESGSQTFLGIHSHGLASFSLSDTGTYILTARQPEETLDFYPADPVDRIILVKGFQTLTFPKIPQKVYGDAPFLPSGRNTAPLPITYYSAHTNITIQNNSVSINGAGTVSITAFINETHPYYFPTGSVTQIFTIKKAKQSITFHPLSVRTLGHADSIVVLTPSASSSLPISLRVSGSSVVVNANTLTVKRAGVVLIEAFQSGNENYESASTVKYLTIIDPSKRNQTITFAPIPNDTLYSEGDSVRIMLTATASSSLHLQFLVGVDTNFLDRNSYKITTYGIYTITALQDGDTAFNPAPPVSHTFTVKRPQSIAFNPIPQKNYEATPFFIDPYSTSGLEVQFSLSNDSVISITPDNLVTIQKVGTVRITAKQRGNDEYYATDSITRILVVTKADQYFVFKPIPSKIYEDPPILLPATTNAGLNIMYSSASNLINIKEDTLQIIAGGGLVRITAYNTGNKFYNTLAPVSRTFSISKAEQSIHFPQILNKIYGDAPIILDSISNKNRPITYTSSNPNILYIEKNTASILRAGSTTLSATAYETNQYIEASKTQDILISPASQIITFSELPLVYLQDKSFVLNARSTSTLPITYSSSNPNIAYITGNTVFFQAFGNVFITASQPAVENYYTESGSARQLLTIKDRTASDIEILHKLAGVGYVGDTLDLPTDYQGTPVFFEITKNTNGNGRTIGQLDETGQRIILLDTGKLELTIYTEPLISRIQRINPAIARINITVKITYKINGRVLGADNEVVPGFVLVTNPTLRQTRRAELSNGYFSFKNVPGDWTFYLQAYPKESVFDSYYPTYYGSQQSITWTNADTIRLTSPKTDFYWNFLKRPQSTISTGNGNIIGKVLLDTTKNENRILYGNFFGKGIPYPYAHIFLKNTADSVLSSDISRTNGEFYFTKLPAGSYRIAANIPGTALKNLNDTLFLSNEENTLYLTIIIRKDNTIELIRNIEKLPQTIHFSPVYKYYGDEPFPIAATATSGLPLTFSSSSSLISIDRDIVTIRGTGTCIITAFQSGNEYYSPSNPTSQVMAVEKAYQSITMQTNIINDPYTFSERRVIIKATASSGLPVQMTPSEPTITNRGDTFFVRGIDIFKMEALQSGNENYHPEQIFQDIIIDPNAIAVENPFITIFPNPADDYITIQWDKSQNVSSIRLYDVKGNGVSDGGLGIGYGVSIDIKTMSKGEYIVVVYGEKGEILKAEKVIKN